MRAMLPLLFAWAALAGCPHPASSEALPAPGRYGVPHEDVVEQGTQAGVAVDFVTPRFPHLPQPGGAALEAAMTAAVDAVRAEAQRAEAERSPEERAERPDLLLGAWARYDLRYVDARWLSIRQDLSTYLGGAHPNGIVRAYLFDLTTGAMPTLPDLFTDAGWARLDARLRAHLRAQLRALGADAGEVDRWPGPTAATAFTLQTDALVVVLQQNEVGPYVLGNVEVAVPWAEVRRGLRPGLDLPPFQDPRF
jgi:hypothetical protein